ncbi:kinase-like protein [Aspergillus ibericus CBS 121593]|uniref:Kinase-like protein n=1 Tax=Aspergillus ibericus CBS 121593 TaxID=1448316 RepID=A0A395GXI3_9EURO|nr:kinase-like protein [Aspergillus ibericus CBS 121593]RAK98773.1 kinase-like protein [Aspergillus ibericus CBS 121593]
MLASLLRSLPRLGRAWKPLNFCNPNFVRIPISRRIEEETMPDYVASRYYPARIGEIFKDRYQIVGKLGFGASSTVWLARDMNCRRYVTLKIFIKSASMGQQLDDELQMYKRMERGSKNHPGRSAVRSLLDSFDVDGPEDKHRCLVHPPLWDSVLTFLHRNPEQRLPAPVLAFVLKRLFLALDYLHTECQIIHSDIKADNIMFGIADDSVFSEYEEDELLTPCPRKELDGRTIYVSRELRMPRNWGAPVLCDFGSAIPGGVEHTEDIQPNIYRAPEVILEVPWTYSVDIWNVGCMIWNIFEGESLFTGYDPEFQTYRSRAHLAEITRLLGPPPPNLLARGKLGHKFFSDEGKPMPPFLHYPLIMSDFTDGFCAKVLLEDRIPLEKRETTLQGQDKANFLRLMRKMLQWEPANRSSARELQEDVWICKTLE